MSVGPHLHEIVAHPIYLNLDGFVTRTDDPYEKVLAWDQASALDRLQRSVSVEGNSHFDHRVMLHVKIAPVETLLNDAIQAGEFVRGRGNFLLALALSVCLQSLDGHCLK